MQAIICDMCQTILPPKILSRPEGEIVKITLHRAKLGNYTFDICPRCSKILLNTIYENKKKGDINGHLS